MYAWMHTSTFCPPDIWLTSRQSMRLFAVIFRLGARKHMYLCDEDDNDINAHSTKTVTTIATTNVDDNFAAGLW